MNLRTLAISPRASPVSVVNDAAVKFPLNLGVKTQVHAESPTQCPCTGILQPTPHCFSPSSFSATQPHLPPLCSPPLVAPNVRQERGLTSGALGKTPGSTRRKGDRPVRNPVGGGVWLSSSAVCFLGGLSSSRLESSQPSTVQGAASPPHQQPFLLWQSTLAGGDPHAQSHQQPEQFHSQRSTDTQKICRRVLTHTHTHAYTALWGGQVMRAPLSCTGLATAL